MAFFDFGGVPGIAAAKETAEKQFLWGKQEQALFRSAIIVSTASDPGNSPTTELRTGLVLALLSTGKWTTYDSDAIDGSQIAQGVLASTVKVVDSYGTARDAMGVVVVGGPVKGNQLLYKAPVASSSTLTGLDQQGRAQLSRSFKFDDDLIGNPYPYKNWITKAADYTVLTTDNGVVFEATTGAVNFTLPALLDSSSNPQCKGMRFKFVNTTDNAMAVLRAGTDTIIAKNNASAVSITTASSNHIGAVIEIETNTAGTKWVANVYSTATYTVA
jgi:hypothetical protein